MDEYIDVLDPESGEKTGYTALKNTAHKEGLWHASVHIFIISSDRKFMLMQKRCSLKDIYPDMWDISVGGHVSSGEEPLESAKRELSEELGLDSEKFDFKELCSFTETIRYRGLVNNEFVTVFVIQSDIELSKLSLQKEEVSDAEWFSKDEIFDLVSENRAVPHIRYDLLEEVLL